MRRLAAFILFSAALASAQTAMPIVGSTWLGTAGGGGTFTAVQFKYRDSAGAGTGGGTCSGGGTTCAVTISAIGASHLVVVFSLMGQQSGGGTMSAPTATGQSFTHCTTCTVGVVADGNIDAYYTLSSASNAATTVTCNFSGANATGVYNSCGVLEASYSGASVSFDVAGGSALASCSTCAAPALTLTGTVDAIYLFALSIPASTGVTALSDATYNSPTAPLYSNTGTAGKLNAASYTAPNWTVTTAAATTVMGVAFKGN